MKKFSFLSVFLLFITNMFALPTIINFNTTWSTNMNFTDYVEIKRGAILTINAGVTVTFTSNSYLKVTNGSIIANGTSSSNITFTANSTNWIGIRFDAPNGGGTSQFTYCIFEYAKKGTNTTSYYTSSDCGGALYINDWGNVSVQNCTFRHNNATRGGAVYISSYSSNITTDPYFESNTFEYNEADGGGAVACNGLNNSSVCVPTFSGNYLHNNLAYWAGGAFLIEKSAVPVIDSNTIGGNNCYCSYYVTSFSGGGAIAVGLASDPIIHNNQINANNSICEGGAILIWDVSEPFISENMLDGNIAQNDGGAIYVNTSEPTIEYNYMHTNISYENGGGISFTNSSDATCENNTFLGNTSYNDGGGIYCNYSVPLIEYNSINTNTSRNNGGGICCVNNDGLAYHYIELNSLTGNSAYEDGGGIYYDANLDVYIINNLIVNSFSTYGGGIFFGSSQNNTVVNSNTIADNQGSNDGGGIYCDNNIGSYANNIIWGNSPNSANDDLSNYPTDDYPNFSYCDIAGYSGSSIDMLNIDPSFNAIGSIDYRVHGSDNIPLWLHSHCIDAGNSGASHTSYDLTGTKARVLNIIIDMGAYENEFSNPDPFIFIPDTLLSINPKSNKTTAQIFPNPAVSEVSIKFKLAEKSNVKIEIFDIYGKIISSVTDQSYLPGTQQLNWKIGNTPQGIYLCKLFINNNLATLSKFVIE